MKSVENIKSLNYHDISGTSWKRIYNYINSYWKSIALAGILMASAAATQPTLALVMKPLLDEGFSGERPSYVWWIPVIIVSLIFIRGICNFFSYYLLAWVSNNVLKNLRNSMFERLLNLPDFYFKQGETGRLLNRFTIDVSNVTGIATEVMIVLIRESFVVLALLAVLFYISWLLTLIVITMLFSTVIITKFFIKQLRFISLETININAELIRVVGEAINNQRVIKLFGGYSSEKNRFNLVNSRFRHFAMRAATADAALTPLTQLCIAISAALIIVVALNQANNEILTVGGFASFMTAVAQIPDPIKRLANVTGRMQRMLAAAQNVFALIDQPQEFNSGTQMLTRPIKGKIEFRNIQFQFPNSDRPTLKNISFTIKPGQTVALVGRSGSGKTTLINMLARFILADSGNILIDDIPIQKLDLFDLRSNLSLVSQDTVFFDDTIAANIGYGLFGTYENHKIRSALNAANLLDFVESLPNGMETRIGENAILLSGGQRQKLAIARALIKNSAILILDEATSALDNESESQIQKSLDYLMQGRTTLVITHRLSTIQNADCIFVMDSGEILESGSHSELIKSSGIYASLHKMQFHNI